MPRAIEEQLPAPGCFRNDRGHGLWEEITAIASRSRLHGTFVEEKIEAWFDMALVFESNLY